MRPSHDLKVYSNCLQPFKNQAVASFHKTSCLLRVGGVDAQSVSEI